MKRFVFALSFIALSALSAYATSFPVSAYYNSVANSMLNTGIYITAGQTLTITADPSEIWQWDPNPHYSSNANGGWYNMGSIPISSLVGKVDGSDYFFIGTDFSQQACCSGFLYLGYWDSDYYNNSGIVNANVSVTGAPLPGAAAVMLLGSLTSLGYIRRKK